MRPVRNRRVDVRWLHAAEREYRNARALNRRGESLPAERTSVRVRWCREHRSHDDKIDIERARMRDLRASMA